MNAAVPKIRFHDSQIQMAHGAGGKASRKLVEGLLHRFYSAPRQNLWAMRRISTSMEHESRLRLIASS